MPTYRMTCIVGVSAYTVVEAESEKEAIEIAEQRDAVIGGDRWGNDEAESWIIEEADGSPRDIAVSSVA
jgi:hypothetical protein